jgi:hypothetical protein
MGPDPDERNDARLKTERNRTMKETIVASNVSCAIISAKWALDLNCSQPRQILFGIGGLILGPIMLLILYVFLINQKVSKV